MPSRSARAAAALDVKPELEGYAAAAAPSRAGERIQSLLETQAEDVPVEALRVLSQMEVRKLPLGALDATDSPSESSPSLAPRTCCFDLSSCPPAWSSHRICVRCQAINSLLHGE